MATSKSTVVGIRLDHERRAWVEAEAARLGVSVRGLFEGMIDGARSGEAAEASRAGAGLGSGVPGSVSDQPSEQTPPTPRGEAAPAAEELGSVDSPFETPPTTAAGSSHWSPFGPVTALPGGLIRGAFTLTAGLIESSAQCATKKLGTCALTRRWAERSL
jgi:hypothetical protein